MPTTTIYECGHYLHTYPCGCYLYTAPDDEPGTVRMVPCRLRPRCWSPYHRVMRIVENGGVVKVWEEDS